MAGIVATSATTNNSASTAADSSVSGYLTGEQITLTTTPTGSSYAWTLSAPSGSTRAVLTSSTSSAPQFKPDVEGYYVVTVTVDSSTVYVLRIATVNVGTVSTIGATRLLPLADSQVSTPSTGVSLYYSSTQSSLAIKLTDGSVETINTTAV